MKTLVFLTLHLVLITNSLAAAFHEDLPISYQGRIRPFQAYSAIVGKSTPATETDQYSQTANMLREKGYSPEQIKETLEVQFPLRDRLLKAGSLLKILPGKLIDGEWYSLSALNIKRYDPATKNLVPIENFTLYSDTVFHRLNTLYQQLKNAPKKEREQITDEISKILKDAYGQIEAMTYLKAHGKALYYPTQRQLAVETIAYKYPFETICLTLYSIAAILLILGYPNRLTAAGLFFLAFAFCLHTTILAMRCYILNRPPVSNMFETVIYVPWVTVIASFALFFFTKNRLSLIASCFASIVLLIVLKLTHLNSGMENVQAVLDSQFWLIIHVLMVVGSYGVFILAGVLGHIYLAKVIVGRRKALESIAKMIVQSIYLGTALLIPGTILGGIWAAQSWGRFWDWDPKEAWAFISSCIYLMGIHAYRFKHIGDFGIAVGSIIGLMAISFTWYGVNYILGTGLHTYGFGNGGEGYYYAYLISETVFVVTAFVFRRSREARLQKQDLYPLRDD